MSAKFFHEVPAIFVEPQRQRSVLSYVYNSAHDMPPGTAEIFGVFRKLI